jgi:hypothetical protein
VFCFGGGSYYFSQRRDFICYVLIHETGRRIRVAVSIRQTLEAILHKGEPAQKFAEEYGDICAILADCSRKIREIKKNILAQNYK